MLGWDRHLEAWQAAHRAGFLDPIFKGLTYAGTHGAVWLAIAAVAALMFRRPQVFIATLAADVAGELLSDLLKEMIPRTRPHVHTLVSQPRSHSFPSGHATTSFACATVLALAVPQSRVPLLLLAAAVAWSRVYVGVHFPIDVLAGAVLGAAIGYCVVRAFALSQTLTVSDADGHAGKAGTS